jgi:hypothetical protein
MSALGHKQTYAVQQPRLLYPQKQTCAAQPAMSAKGQKRTFPKQRCREGLLAPLLPRLGLRLQIQWARSHRRLPNFNKVPIRVTHVTPQFPRMDFGLRNEFCPP